jgi:hypothetical protein
MLLKRHVSRVLPLGDRPVADLLEAGLGANKGPQGMRSMLKKPDKRECLILFTYAGYQSALIFCKAVSIPCGTSLQFLAPMSSLALLLTINDILHVRLTVVYAAVDGKLLKPGRVSVVRTRHLTDGGDLELSVQAVHQWGLKGHLYLIIHPFSPRPAPPDFKEMLSSMVDARIARWVAVSSLQNPYPLHIKASLLAPHWHMFPMEHGLAALLQVWLFCL